MNKRLLIKSKKTKNSKALLIGAVVAVIIAVAVMFRPQSEQNIFINDIGMCSEKVSEFNKYASSNSKQLEQMIANFETNTSKVDHNSLNQLKDQAFKLKDAWVNCSEKISKLKLQKFDNIKKEIQIVKDNFTKMYGSIEDIEKNITDKSKSYWNIQSVNTILQYSNDNTNLVDIREFIDKLKDE